MKPDIKRFTETGVVFEDGSEVEHVDEVISMRIWNFNRINSGDPFDRIQIPYEPP